MDQCLTHLKVSQCLRGVFIGATFTERVTDGISNQCSDKYYFPLLKGGRCVTGNVYPRAPPSCEVMAV